MRECQEKWYNFFKMLSFAAIFQNAIILFSSFVSFAGKLSFSWTDFLDIGIVAILIFLTLYLFRKTKSTPIIFGILLLGLLYALGLALNLRLTQTIFSFFFGILLVIITIIFQKELRRFFELIGLIGLRRKISLPVEAVFKTVSRTVEYLVRHSSGAIIIFPGIENIERHLEGGITLDGRVSRALLISIFDKSSPGHDGAVIIEGDRIKKFAVHLPLAEQASTSKKFGTRHHAALGLAERTDAFIIVVSEERGEISIAHNKRILPAADFAELEEKLRLFYEQKFPQKKFGRSLNWLKFNYKSIIASAILAFSLWIFFSYQTSAVQRRFNIPVQFRNLNVEYVVSDYYPEEIIIVFAGRESDFKLLDIQSLKASVDLSDAKPGWRQLIIKKEAISYPSIITLVKIEPESIRAHIEKIEKPVE